MAVRDGLIGAVSDRFIIKIRHKKKNGLESYALSGPLCLQSETGRCRDLFYYLENPARFRLSESRIFFRILKLEGVISKSSSVSINSRACSRLNSFFGVRRSASSALDDLVLVSCFFLQTLISISSALPVWPTTIPAYTFSPGSIKRIPRPCALNRPYVIASPSSKAISEPCLRYIMSPL